jgi:3-oxoacyl-[acyl-carrier protein] reductase
MDVSLLGRTALVTGGARGLGRGFSLALAKSGARVIFTSRDAIEVKALSDEFAKTNLVGYGIQCDVTSQDGLTKLQDHLNESGHQPDILINNVGHTLGVQTPEASYQDWLSVLKLNLLSHIEVTNRFLPEMKKREWGRIVNITSIAGLEVSGPAPFNCAKAALTAYTRSAGRLLAIENPGVVMTAVAPGIVETPGGHWESMKSLNPEHVVAYLTHRAGIKRFGEIDEITGIVVFLSSNFASFFHGAIIQVDGGQSRSYFPHTFLD